MARDELDPDPDGAERDSDGVPVGLTPSERAGRYAASVVARELAESAARASARASAARDDEQPRHRRRIHGPSVVYTVRLGHDEVDELERRADVLGIPPSALARNYIRTGLQGRGRVALAHAVDEVEAALARLRDTVG